MRKYANIPGDVLDRLTVYLRYETAVEFGMCGEARWYWTNELGKKTLLVCEKTIRAFQRIPFPHTRWGTIDVGTWAREYIQGEKCVDVDLPYREGHDFTARDICRCLKAVLLGLFEPMIFVQLGGLYSIDAVHVEDFS